MKKLTGGSHSFEGSFNALPIQFTQPIACEVVHATVGRWRIHIPELGRDRAYADRLQNLIASLYFVSDVRINLLARSLVVEYSIEDVTLEDAAHRLLLSIQQAASKFPQLV